eukprot:gnl/TRDRNA2_/TRDRNA2_38803_c0_seq1.p1 gnl/TRDRNA2_/TRDRNA2_38803_c0~~gnl/TRDRNA2_/TRDRNA2_38803_c0_seq1.p1  ORF type:complete len:235 (+),score=32.77 gnl/TRDRNA2_/TRDRNA2_38803_c0_seq1:110-814(+)
MVHNGLLLALWLCKPWGMLSLKTPEAQDPYVFVHDGFEYRTIQNKIAVDGAIPDQKSARCHRDWEPMPEGYHLAPDTEELRKVLTTHTWSTHTVIFSALKAYTTFAPAGQPFGDSQDKAHGRVRNGTVEYMCPWECYQVIVRKPIADANTNKKEEEEAPERRLAVANPVVPGETTKAALSDCKEYCRTTGCGWNNQWSCPWAPEPGRSGRAGNDGTLGYKCCCEVLACVRGEEL